MVVDMEARLKGTRRGHIVQEFFTNSGHFPLAIVLFEFLMEGTRIFPTRPDIYVLLVAGVVQAVIAGTWQYRDTPRPLVGNLIAPGLYSVVEVAIEGVTFFSSPQHVAYWIIAFAIGGFQMLRLHTTGVLAEAFALLENVVRTSIVLVLYWLFEALTHPDQYGSVADFLSDNSHVFVAVVIPLLGIFVGTANANADRYLSILRRTAAQLRLYSEWFFGRDLLSHAVANPDVLTLQRRARSVLFMDIRGFTRWSESRSPEEVVAMLNAYFTASERVWATANPIKVKLSADEVMLVLPDPREAVRVAGELVQATGAVLSAHGLGAGIGVNTGSLVEGLLGSESVRGYDVIGDTVNTAKRLCDAAGGGEVLLAESTYKALAERVPVGMARQLSVKGKEDPLIVYPLQ